MVERTPSGSTLHLKASAANMEAVLKALGSETRLRILDVLNTRVMNISEIAEMLGMPLSTTNLHISALENAGLLATSWQPAQRGRQKICTRVYDAVFVQLPNGHPDPRQTTILSLPVGLYTDANVTLPCGLLSHEKSIGILDDPASFYEPQHVEANTLWFHQGYIEYRFPNRIPDRAFLDCLRLSLEIGSEATGNIDAVPSDITFWINGVEIGTWRCPADFGGERGSLSPDGRENHTAAHGLLKVWEINSIGATLDGIQKSSVCLVDLNLHSSPFISVRIGVKPGVECVGGVRIFGSHSGTGLHDIALQLTMTRA